MRRKQTNVSDIGCGDCSMNSGATPVLRNQKFAKIILMIFSILLLSSCQYHLVEYKSIGCPTKEYYPDNKIARCIWDMALFDDKLYVGCGDYNMNSGATPVLYCDLDDIGNWKKQATLPDEQIGRFLILDNKLTIPGLDPLGSPGTGTYYQLENGTWKTRSGLPDGQHNFDLIRFDGKLFAGIGADREKTPIAVSEDDVHFDRVPMLKNGSPISTSGGECIRTHHFFVLNNQLYAEFWYENTTENKLISEIYRYEGDSFVFDNEWASKLHTGLSCKNLPAVFAKAEMNGTLFFSTGLLYSTKNMKELTRISLPDNAYVYDLYVYDEKLYLLTAVQRAKDFKITVFSTKSAEPADFKQEASFTYAVPPTALAVHQDHFFIALGKWQETGVEQNGTVVQLDRAKSF